MTPPPLLGLFHASACRFWAMENRRARALAGEAALQGATVGLFGTTDVDFESGTVRYMRMTPDGWTLWRGPMPDVVLIGRSVAGDADSPTVVRLRTLVPVASWTLPDKAAVSEALQSTALAPYVIPFSRVAAPDAEAVIASFLDEHRRIVLKPADEHFGKRIFFVACDGDDIVMRQFEQRWRWPREIGFAELASHVGGRLWIAQTMIVSRVRDGRAFDIFVHAHKDGNGRWTLVRSYARLSESGVLATITGRGGYLGDLDSLLAALGDRGAALAATVRRLGIRIGETLDPIYGGALDEIGVDIVVDPQHRPWIVEVNSGPVTRFHEFERARPHVAHAMQLARRFKAGVSEAP